MCLLKTVYVYANNKESNDLCHYYFEGILLFCGHYLRYLFINNYNKWNRDPTQYPQDWPIHKFEYNRASFFFFNSLDWLPFNFFSHWSHLFEGNWLIAWKRLVCISDFFITNLNFLLFICSGKTRIVWAFLIAYFLSKIIVWFTLSLGILSHRQLIQMFFFLYQLWKCLTL